MQAYAWEKPEPGLQPFPESPRLAAERARLARIQRRFINESVRRTVLGVKDLDEGRYVTLEDLKKEIAKQER